MRNMIRSDMYRVLRGKSIYITFLIFIVISIIQSAFPGGSIGISVDNVPGVANISGEVNGMLAPFAFMGYTDNIIFFMLSIIFVLVATDFSSGAIKNTLSNGVSRMKLYISKLILACVFCLLMFVSGILISILVSTLMNGYGGVITGKYLLLVLRPFAAQFLMLTAAVSIGVAIIFITKKGATLNALYIAFFLGLTIALFIVAEISPKFNDIIKYDFVINLKMLANMGAMATVDIIRALVIGVVCMITSTILGMVIFRKSEIK